jgi:aspartyl aminopeptidase
MATFQKEDFANQSTISRSHAKRETISSIQNNARYFGYIRLAEISGEEDVLQDSSFKRRKKTTLVEGSINQGC